ncbi:hypothetical protein M0R45_016162 [Rubus argutus]|uniref:Uncharacterized protein n=1 Tax=Rubus argutus TaxID=59490 RepID=A0AAW1XVE1_RUBAR
MYGGGAGIAAGFIWTCRRRAYGRGQRRCGDGRWLMARLSPCTALPATSPPRHQSSLTATPRPSIKNSPAHRHGCEPPPSLLPAGYPSCCYVTIPDSCPCSSSSPDRPASISGVESAVVCPQADPSPAVSPAPCCCAVA